MGVLNFRKYARVEVDIPIKFFTQKADTPLGAYLSNLSEEGASLMCPFSIPAATLLEFDVKLPKISEPAHIRAEVLWSRPVREDGQDYFMHGLVFSRVGIEDRERLHEFISHTMSY
ncbi:MAG: PilZ domain-containing protein [Candidatus Firestonebacteria bacterium]|nr:PilZ domain-containing protein [Candidatus Firestonebacteria bacterium]